jgi:hypothetical protein
MIVSNCSSTMNTSAPASYAQVHPDGMTACQPVVSAADPEQLPTVDGLGVELGVAVTELGVAATELGFAVTVRVDVGVGTAVQTEAAVVFGVQLIDQTTTPTPIAAISKTATIAMTPYFAGTRSGCRLSEADS